MDTFEVGSGNRGGFGVQRLTKWKSRIFVGLVGAVAVTGFIIVLVQSYLFYYESQSNVEQLEDSISVSLTDIQCEEEFCSTKGCIITAARMVDIVNVEVNPCDDFYEYACGNYKLGHFPRFQEESYSPIKEAEDAVLTALKKILDSPASDDDSDSLKKTRILFSSCTNIERRDNSSLEDFRQFLTDINLHWPVLNADWHEDETDWKSVVRKLENSYKISTVFHKHNDISEENPFGNVIIECKIPTLPAAAYQYDNETDMPYIMKMYKELIDFILRPLNVDRNRRKEFIAEITNLEKALARSIMNSSEESGMPPSRNLVQILGGSADHSDELKNNTLSKCDGNINKLLHVLESQPEKTLKNYLGWRTIYSVLRFLTSDMKQLSDAYLGSFPGSPPAHSARFRECSAAVRDEMGLMATKAYLDAGYFTQQEEAEVRNLMTEMKTAFVALLHMLPWMDNNTLSVFQDKLKHMKLDLEYPENLRNDYPVDHLFHDLELNENDTYFLNIMKIREHITSLLGSGYRDHAVDAQPLDTGSAYDYINNKVEMKLGLFQSPMMIYGNYPKYLKYGHAVPFAHEISHAFDTFGSLFNVHGQREGIDWWPDAVKQKFFTFVGCLQHQEAARSGISASEVDNGTINNDIADLGSFFVTYAGLSLHLRIHGEEEKPLPGFSLNKKQTYLVQAAQLFCDVREPRPTIDPYVKASRTGKERVNSAIKNLEDFGAIFECPVGSPMNPQQKCNLLR